jgi:hypothetical protein
VASTPIGTHAAERDLICGGIDACGPTLFHGNPRRISNRTIVSPSITSGTVRASSGGAVIPVFQITAFDLNGCFVCNLMNHSHIGRAILPSSRGGPYNVRLAGHTRPDPGAPRVGCCCIADFRVGCAVPRPATLRFNRWPSRPRGLWNSRFGNLRYVESPSPAGLLEQLPGNGSDDGERPGVLESFGGLVHLLQGQLHVLQERVVIDKAPHASLALIDLLQDILQVG